MLPLIEYLNENQIIVISFHQNVSNEKKMFTQLLEEYS